VPEVPLYPERSLIDQVARPSPSPARSRASSTAMSRATASGAWLRRRRVIEHGGTLLSEAGTGTENARLSDSRDPQPPRVLVSTGTKNLQEQIFFKDLPALSRALRCRSPPR
jgi:Rad3-related DNA helicase